MGRDLDGALRCFEKVLSFSLVKKRLGPALQGALGSIGASQGHGGSFLTVGQCPSKGSGSPDSESGRDC